MAALPYAQLASVLRALDDQGSVPWDEVGSPEPRRLAATFEGLLDLAGSVTLSDALAEHHREGAFPDAPTAVTGASVEAVRRRLARIEERLLTACDELRRSPHLLPVEDVHDAFVALARGELRRGVPTRSALLAAAQPLAAAAHDALRAPFVRAAGSLREIRVELLPTLVEGAGAARRLLALDETIAAVTGEAARRLEARFEAHVLRAFAPALAQGFPRQPDAGPPDADAPEGGLPGAATALRVAAARARGAGGALHRWVELAQNGHYLLVRPEIRRLEAIFEALSESFCV